MSRRAPSRGWRYAAAVLAVTLVALLHALVLPFVSGQGPYVFLLAAVLFSAWYGRFGPGVLATLLGALLADLLFIPPYWRFLGNGAMQDVRLLLFVAEGLFVCVLVHRLHVALEQSEQTRQALCEADRRKDEFLAVLAHELRGPLAPITHGVRLLRDPRIGRDASRKTLEIIDRQLQGVVRLVDDLMDVSRIARGQIELQKRSVELAAVLMRAVEIGQPLMDAHRHQLTVTQPPQPVWLEGDPLRLAQALGNLLCNAAKYTPDGGQIRLSAALVGAEVCLSVRDNGIGIPREMLPHVFDLFTQVPSGRDRAEGGLGLGLALVRSLIERHDGSVEATSGGPGRGSEFLIRLPTTAAPARPEPKSSPRIELVRRPTARRDSPPLRVLIVDDSLDAAQALAMLLRFDGHEVRTAGDGPAALELAGTFRPDAVLLDISLPGLSGYEVARRLRQTEAGRPLRLVAMTGHAQPEDRRRSREAGFDEHLVKPVSLDQLQAVLAPPASVP